MSTFYEDLFHQVEMDGVEWKIDLRKKTITFGKDVHLPHPEDIRDVTEKMMDNAFCLYKHSIPTRNDPSRPYFAALKYDKLSESDKTFGDSRELARFRLEYMVLCSVLSGVIHFEGDKWFWRSASMVDFIVLRSFVEE